MRLLLIVHILAMLLASTDYSVVTSAFGGGQLHWEYFLFSQHSGWGPRAIYTPDNSLLVVLTYLIGFVCGAVAYLKAMSRGNRCAGTLGLILSLIGIISYSIELSHWGWSHTRSWILCVPSLMIILAVKILWTESSHRKYTTATTT